MNGKSEDYIFIRKGKLSRTSLWRYAIAFGIASQIFYDEDIEASNEYREPMWYDSVNDIIVNNFALLILMPISVVSNLLCKFATTIEYETLDFTTTENWLRILSESSKVPIDIAHNAYQIMKNIFGMADQINDPKLFKLKEKCSKMFY